MDAILGVILSLTVLWSIYRMVFGTAHVPVAGWLTPALYRALGDKGYRFVFLPILIACGAAWIVALLRP